MISGILLAAGESRRMGDLKQLMRLGDKSFVEHCVDNLLASRVDEVIVVTGHRSLEVQHAVGERPVRFAYNADYPSGMASSIKCGVQATSERARACLLALVDQPQIDAALINSVIETYAMARTKIVIPTYAGKKGHPILLDLSLKDEILTMDLEHGLRRVVRAHADRISFVEANDSAVLEDCDLPADYERMLKR